MRCEWREVLLPKCLQPSLSGSLMLKHSHSRFQRAKVFSSSLIFNLWINLNSTAAHSGEAHKMTHTDFNPLTSHMQHVLCSQRADGFIQQVIVTKITSIEQICLEWRDSLCVDSPHNGIHPIFSASHPLSRFIWSEETWNARPGMLASLTDETCNVFAGAAVSKFTK